MSELEPSQRPRRRRRADAARSVNAILDAAIRLLGERPDASIEDIAEAAGLARQTVYAHFASREILLGAVADRATRDALAAIDAADLDTGPAAEALLRFLDAGWQTTEHYPLLLSLQGLPAGEPAELERHEPVLDRLERLVRRGQDAGEFEPRLSPKWLLAATVALGHAAGEQVGAGLMTAPEAAEALKRSVLRLFGTGEDQMPPAGDDAHAAGPAPRSADRDQTPSASSGPR